MPRAARTDKFYMHAPPKKGREKGKSLIGINHNYVGGVDAITLQDLLDFLKEHDIDPVRVNLPSHYTTLV